MKRKIAELLLLMTWLVLLGTQNVVAKAAGSPLTTPWAEKIDVQNVLAEYPRPQLVRSEWMNLNGQWQFQEAQAGDKLPFNAKLKETILVPFPWESALSGIHRDIKSHKAFYRRTFEVPAGWHGQNVQLNFGAVDWEASVYVNGCHVGSHSGGYDGFSFDITAALRKKGPQEIVVSVFDPGSDQAIACGKQSNDRFADPHGYSYCASSGIWQTVWIEPVSKAFVESVKMVPDIDAGTLLVSAFVENVIKGQSVVFEAFDGNLSVSSVICEPGKTVTMQIPSAKLWSPDSPFLYDLKVTLQDSTGKAIDKVVSYFGMRKIALKQEASGIQRIYLNNQFLFQMGPLDQGYWPDGIYTAPTDEALRWDIENIKSFGFNMIRKHIKVEPERWYYWADKLGVLVWQDMPSTFKVRSESLKTQWENELSQMVRTHWNHPAIVVWIVFNEHWGIYDVERNTNTVMALDPSRLVTGNSGIDAGKPNLDFEVGHIKDNHSYRPPNCRFATNKRAVVCGEYGAIGYNIPGHIWDVDGPWVHYNYDGLESATTEYEKFIRQLVNYKKEGLCAGVYTQWTDVENEMNGLYTYDRKIIKLDKARVKAANESTRIE